MGLEQVSASTVHGPSIVEIFIMIWFSVSVIIEIVGNIVLRNWLRHRGVKLIFVLTGTPGYLEGVYLKFCRSQGQSATRVLTLRVISMINIIIVGIIFILMVAK
jgi:hypothetical protein